MASVNPLETLEGVAVFVCGEYPAKVVVEGDYLSADVSFPLEEVRCGWGSSWVLIVSRWGSHSVCLNLERLAERGRV